MEELQECYKCGRDTDNIQGLCDDCKFDEQINEELEDSDVIDPSEADSSEPQHSTYSKIAGGKYNVINKTSRKMTIAQTKDEAKRTAAKWDKELGLSPKGNKSSGKSKRKRIVDENGIELPTKTELIQEGVRRGMTWREIAAYARCRYQMAYNIGSRYAKAHPQLVDSEKVAVITVEDES